MAATLERNQTYAFALLAGALVLLGLSTAGLEGNLLEVSSPAPRASAATNGAPLDQFGALFSAEPFEQLLAGERRRDVFFTGHFNQPAQPKPVPEPPKSRNVAVTFLGTLAASDGETAAFVRLDQHMVQLEAGGRLVADWGVAAITGTGLVLTNGAQTNQVGFRQTLQLSVPIP
jgi:hypothetical protein